MHIVFYSKNSNPRCLHTCASYVFKAEKDEEAAGCCLSTHAPRGGDGGVGAATHLYLYL